MLFVNSLSDDDDDDDEVGSGLFLVKETTHSLSLILGLDLVTLILIRLGIVEGMTNTHCSETGWTFLALFGAGATRAAAFLF